MINLTLKNPRTNLHDGHANANLCNRTFFCDVICSEQPLVTVISDKEARLPFELEDLTQEEGVLYDTLPDLTVSCLTSPKIGGFGRVAQAAFLLDEVLKALSTKSVDSRLVKLDALDAALQKFLAVVMQQCHEVMGGFFCGAIALAIRSVHYSPIIGIL